MPAPNAISFDKLTRIIGTPRAPLLLDVRSEEDFATDPRLLPGAARIDDQALAALASQLGGQPSIAVCQPCPGFAPKAAPRNISRAGSMLGERPDSR